MPSLRRLVSLLICLVAPPGLSGQSAPPPGPAKAPALDAYGDPLPEFARARLGTLRFRNGVPIASLSFVPDGKAIRTIGHDRIARLWETATGKEHFEFRLLDRIHKAKEQP